MRRRALLPAMLAWPAAPLLGGCITLDLAGPTQAELQYEWHDDAAAPVPLARPIVPALLLQSLPGTPMADTTALFYTRGTQAFAEYQYARWTERPLRVLPRLLQRRLEARGVAGATAVLGDPQRSDWLLTLSIDALHHDTQAAPGSARLALTAGLFDRRARQRVAWRRFDAAVPVAAADAAAAVDGLSAALTRCLDALLPWLEETLAAAVR